MTSDTSISRRLAVQSLLATGLAAALPARAQTFPNRTISWMVPYAVGAATDLLTRRLAQELAASLGQSVIVENVPGGGSTVGAARLAKDNPDGHRIITLDVAGLAIHPAAAERLAYDPVKSFTPISMAWRIPFVLVTHAAQGPRTLAQLLTRAKAQPDALTYGSAGVGSAIHMAMVLLEDQAGVRLTHIPYSGAAPALQDVLAGRVDAMFISLGAALPHLKSGRLQAIAASGSKRFEASPEIATIAEQGVAGYEASSWQGVLGPAGMPDAVRDRLNRAIGQALATPSVVERFKAAGADPEPSSPQAFAAYIRNESAKWAHVIRAKGIRLDQ
jgi:tripartite-type tricarboxylate transporter receptor subunit TctC